MSRIRDCKQAPGDARIQPLTRCLGEWTAENNARMASAAKMVAQRYRSVMAVCYSSRQQHYFLWSWDAVRADCNEVGQYKNGMTGEIIQIVAVVQFDPFLNDMRDGLGNGDRVKI